MYMRDCWLPNLIFCPDNAQWREYEERIYRYYKNDLIDDHPIFKNKPVIIRWPNLIENGKEKEFWHIVYKEDANTNNRLPDLNRCERILWLRALIENWESCMNKLYEGCADCEGLIIWEEKDNRLRMLLKDERFLLVLEERTNCWLLITAFYVDHDSYFRKLLRRAGETIDKTY